MLEVENFAEETDLANERQIVLLRPESFGEKVDFFKNGPSPASFSFIFVFSNKFLQLIYAELVHPRSLICLFSSF